MTEISIERETCFGSCPAYTLQLQSDGSVSYDGHAYVEPLGHRTGKMNLHDFATLARLAVEIGYFELDDSYSCQVTDNPTVYTRVTRNGNTKLIMHYAPRYTGPARLRSFEDLVSHYAEFIEWSDGP